jgi:transposase
MRTIKRYSLPLNQNKWKQVYALAEAYSQEKDDWLVQLSKREALHRVGAYRKLRDELVKVEYTSRHGLQARQWKLALKDAVETVDKNWRALIREIKPRIGQNSHLNEGQKHYCYWVLKDYSRIEKVIDREYERPPFVLSWKEIRQAGHYLNRVIRRHRGRSPRVKRVRSFCVDATMYRVFIEKGRQYLSVMSLSQGQRVIIPLSGETVIEGNLRIVLDESKQAMEVHYAVEIKPRWVAEPEKEEAVDFGISEVMTTSAGKRYGEEFGQKLKGYSEQLQKKGKKRNRLRALREKAQQRGDKALVRRIGKQNLGKKKQLRFRQRMKATLEGSINEAFNRFYKETRPEVLVVENLRHAFSRKETKVLNRLIGFWSKGILQDRTEFKAEEGGSLLKQVNAAYGSQTCVRCGFVWGKNRQGDTFKCQFCRYGADSDRVAAMNYLARSHDREISLYVPYKEVKGILVKRFRRRLESWDFEFLPDQVNWEAVSYLYEDWETLRDKAVGREVSATVWAGLQKPENYTSQSV